ncbi:MAG: HEAT repeat domain-containing protein [Oligoflexia bacterium]|nr:HEAT repeat domain-containing protein [Oligoflexia bacterium]
MQITRYIQKLNTSSDHAAEKTIQQLVKKKILAIPLLVEAAKDSKKPKIQKWSLEALGAIGDKKSAKLLISALKDERMTIRLHALRALGRMKYTKAAPQITKLLNDSSGGIRLNALQTLLKLKKCPDKNIIIVLLKDPQWYIRQYACIACEEFKITKAIPKLVGIYKKEKPFK